MAWVLIEHRVGDFEAFTEVFVGDAARRARLGCTGALVYQVADDPGTVIVLLEWESLEAAREFAGSLELEMAMEWAVSHIATPRVTVLDLAIDSPH